MKKFTKLSMFLWLLAAGTFAFVACSEEDDPTPLTLTSLKADGMAIDGTTSFVADVPVDADIIATFSADVDAATVTTTSVTLTKGTTDVTVFVSVLGAEVTITPFSDLEPGAVYTLSIANTVAGLGEEAFTAVTFSFTTEGKAIVEGPQAEHLITHLLFEGNIDDHTGNRLTYETAGDITYAEDRAGNANAAASFADGKVVEILTEVEGDLFPQNITISYWMKAEPLEENKYSRMILGIGAKYGLYLEYFHFTLDDGTHIHGLQFNTNHENEGTNVSTYGQNWYQYKAEKDADGKGLLTNVKGSVETMLDSKWVHMVLSYDSSTNLKTIYIDGVKVCQVKINYTEEQAPEWNLTNLAFNDEPGVCDNFSIGSLNSVISVAPADASFQYDENKTFKGLMDDFRIYDVALSAAEVTALYDAEK